MKLSRNCLYGVFTFLFFSGIILSCDLFNNSMVDNFLDNVEIAQVSGLKVKTEYAMMNDDTILIPPGTAKIGVILSNPRNFSVRQELLGVPGGKNITADQISPAEIEVNIDGAEEGEEYALTLVMQSPDGLRDFPAYSLRIKCVSFQTALQDFTVNGATLPAFDPAKDAFLVNVPYTSTTVALGGTTVHPGAVVEIYAGKDDSGAVLTKAAHTAEITQDLDVGNNYFYVKITAPSSTVQGYAVTVCRAMDSEKAITAFYFTIDSKTTGPKHYGVGTGLALEDGSGSISGPDITITVPYGTDISSMIPVIIYTGENISPAVGTAQDFTNPVTCTITAADGTSQAYTVTVNVLPNTAGIITAFNITSPVIAAGAVDEALKTITVNVPYGTDVTAMTASITHTGASISPDPAAARSYAGQVEYTVTAEDGTTQDYTVTVNTAPNTAKAITAFSITSPVIAAGTVNESTHSITVTVPYGTPVTAMTASITHTGASISPDPALARSYTGQVEYTVTAEDGTSEKYTVTVNAAKIASVTAVNGNFVSPDGFVKTGSDVSGADIKNKVISVTGTDSLGTAITLAAADYSVDDITGTAAGANVTATLRVPAAKSSTGGDITEGFTVYVRNDAKAITAFNITSPVIAAGAVDEGLRTVTVNVPYGTDVTAMTASITHTGVSISPDPALARSYAGQVEYTVTAEDGTTETYTVTVNGAQGIAISGITVEGLSALSFTSVPSSVAAGQSISITISGGVTVSDWYIDVNGPVTPTGSTTDTVTFSAPSNPGFYNISVFATVEGILYSGSFGITVN